MTATTTAAPPGTASAPVPLGRRRARLLGGLVVLGVLLAVAGGLGLALGARPIAPADVWSALFSPTGSDDDVVVRALRLPRTVLGVAVGVALGVAGALIQGHTRNPLADPGLLGVSSGAAFGVCLAVYAFGIGSIGGSVWFALAGALVAAVVVFVLGTIGDGGAPVALAPGGGAGAPPPPR